MANAPNRARSREPVPGATSDLTPWPPLRRPRVRPPSSAAPFGQETPPDLSDSTKLTPFSKVGWLDELLQLTVTSKASDLHVMAGEIPRIRLRGELKPLEQLRPLVAGEIDTTLRRITPANLQDRLRRHQEIDFSYTHPEGYRFRVSAFQERRGTALAIRRLASSAYSLEALNLPIDLSRVIYGHSGLVLFAGHAGAGKTTSLFSVLQEFCSRRCGHLMTLEDPIEYRLEARRSYLEQRELGRHFKSYPDGVRDALRANPDALAIGELRDTETIRLALQAAEAGLLVYATVHAYDVTRAVTRVINAFPVEEQHETRIALAYTVRMIAAQTLLKSTKGEGRMPAVEVAHACNALSTLIREGKEHEITTLMEANRGRGMRTLDQSLVQLARSARVTTEEAIFRAVRKENVMRALAQ